MSASPSPKLQPPGAGLPWWELWAARNVAFPLGVRRLKDWAGATRRFREEGDRILAVWDALPAERLTERVLIRRIAGMEDSSRHWSVAMTVEHLNVVGFGVRRIIDHLRRGEVPDSTPRTDTVKPRGESPPAEVRAEFVRLLAEADADPPVLPGEGAKLPHPWFGPLDTFRWRCMLALHQRIHRQQVEAIRAGLK